MKPSGIRHSAVTASGHRQQHRRRRADARPDRGAADAARHDPAAGRLRHAGGTATTRSAAYAWSDRVVPQRCRSEQARLRSSGR